MAITGDPVAGAWDGPTMSRVSAFLFREARLIDERRFDEWVDLFADDGQYWVPCNGPASDPNRQVSIVFDTVEMLRTRLERMKSGKQYAQDPPSRTCHVISNVHVEDGSDGEVVAYSSLVVFEARRHHHKDFFAGACTHRLRSDGDGFRIVEKRVELIDNDQFFDNLTILL